MIWKRLWPAIPVWWVLIDLVYSFATNSIHGLLQASKNGNQASAGLPLSPEIAFNSLQVIVNGSMVAIVGLSLVVLLKLNRAVVCQQPLTLGLLRTLALITVLVFSLPAWWEWIWATIAFAQGIDSISITSFRYLITSLCMPWIGLLCIWRLFGWYKLQSQEDIQTTHVAS